MGTFLFFQHLRKAGGTNFCTLAQRNLPSSQVPPYYCMPDYYWTGGHRCGGCFSQWTNEQIVTNMKSQGHRVLGNEWDPFDSERFFALPAVFATSFRKPLDRALSQFRFECIEDRVRDEKRNTHQFCLIPPVCLIFFTTSHISFLYRRMLLFGGMFAWLLRTVVVRTISAYIYRVAK